MTGDLAMNSGSPSCRSIRFSDSSFSVFRTAFASSIWVRSMLRSRALSHGFSM